MNNILEKVRGLPAIVKISIVFLTIFYLVLFSFAPVFIGVFTLVILVIIAALIVINHFENEN
jgi:hypothetical protein